jgi:hypothetical protein
VVVSFHGDAAAGCASYGLCAYAGTIVIRPRNGTLSILTVRRRGRIGHAATLVLGPGQSGYTTSARVQRSVAGAPGGTCADAQSSPFGGSPLTVVRGSSVTIRLLAPGGSLLQTRCAGPLDRDLAAVAPAATMPVSKALRGRTAIDLSGTGTFAAHGFAGTISSTVVLRLGRPGPSSSSGSPPPPGVKTQRMRIVTEHLSVVRLAGGLGAAIRGSADPIICGLLDTCGLSGTLSLAPVRHGASVQVLAVGPASRPYRDFLTALGLARGGRARGISVGMFVNVMGGVQAETNQAGVACTDTGGTGGVMAAIGAPLGLPATGGSFVGPWRTRCPGPTFENPSGGVSASLPRGALGRRQFTLQLLGRGSFGDDGYAITGSGRMSVVLRRARISQQVIAQPGP